MYACYSCHYKSFNKKFVNLLQKSVVDTDYLLIFAIAKGNEPLA